jgi:hypothetical protein
VKEFRPTKVGNELTRRQWLLVLGRLATVAGFSGLLPEVTAASSGVEGQRLPPGLYHPSPDHLFQALSGLGSMHNVSPGSETEYVEPNASPFPPQFFSDEEFKAVTQIVEILLGKVDAGALSQAVQWLDLYLYSAPAVREAALQLDAQHRALAVAYYGETAVRERETADPQDLARSGFRALHKDSVERYGHEFLMLDKGQQANLISTISTATPDSALRKFLDVVRTEAVRGYYTTAQGLKELDYKGNWYYALCPGCEHKI